MSSDFQRQIKKATQDYELALDNSSLKRREASDLQRTRMDLTSKTDGSLLRLKSAVEKLRSIITKKQLDLDKARAVFEKAQKTYTDAQEAVTHAQTQYSSLDQELRTEIERGQGKIEQEQNRIDARIHSIEKEAKSWEMKADNARRDMEIFRHKSEEKATQKMNERANDNDASASTSGRQQTLR